MTSRFLQIIEAKGITAIEFAKQIGCSQSSVSNVTRGRNQPSFDMLKGIAQTFPDINLKWLITGKGNMYDSPDSPPEREPTLPFRDEDATDRSINRPANRPVNRPVDVSKKAETPPVPPSIPSQNVHSPDKKVRRIILFFDDGSFEDYNRDSHL
jgi:transcriptional regulator with XRE-family HTH domain